MLQPHLIPALPNDSLSRGFKPILPNISLYEEVKFLIVLPYLNIKHYVIVMFMRLLCCAFLTKYYLNDEVKETKLSEALRTHNEMRKLLRK
jgi:hypothetical protein